MKCKVCGREGVYLKDECVVCIRDHRDRLAGELAEAKKQLAAKTAECDKQAVELAALREKAQAVVTANAWYMQLAHKEDDVDNSSLNKAEEDLEYALVNLAAHLSTGKDAIAKAEAEKPFPYCMCYTGRCELHPKPDEPTENCTCELCNGEGLVGSDGTTCECIRMGCRKKHGRDAYLPTKPAEPACTCSRYMELDPNCPKCWKEGRK